MTSPFAMKAKVCFVFCLLLILSVNTDFSMLLNYRVLLIDSSFVGVLCFNTKRLLQSRDFIAEIRITNALMANSLYF
jgi:hypothetical protein